MRLCWPDLFEGQRYAGPRGQREQRCGGQACWGLDVPGVGGLPYVCGMHLLGGHGDQRVRLEWELACSPGIQVAPVMTAWRQRRCATLKGFECVSDSLAHFIYNAAHSWTATAVIRNFIHLHSASQSDT